MDQRTVPARKASHPTCCQFIPPHVLDHMARVTSGGGSEPNAAQRSAVVSAEIRSVRRRAPMDLTTLTPPVPGKSDRAVYDAQNTFDVEKVLVRGESDPEVQAQNVNDAYDFSGAARDYFVEVHDRAGIDDNGMTISANVNYGTALANAFWDGTRILLGNGDGTFFVDLSGSPDVTGHELSHGVVQFTANLDYFSQSGALNESFADVFGSLIEQRLQGRDFGTANWLIGDEIMAPDLYGEALRSMAHPGTAYDNAILGTDPQPDHMLNYYAGPDDNQGVHINSGIPNRAFYLTASELGTENAGRIWYAGLVNLWSTATFADAAQVLADQARLLAREGAVERQAAQVVRGSWRAVGVL